MSMGNFKETSENTETNETKESSIEKPRNQILEVPKEYKDDFDSKVDNADSKNESKQENKAEKSGPLDKFKSFLSKFKESKEQDNSKEKSDNKEEGATKEAPKRNEFKESLKFDPEELNKNNETSNESKIDSSENDEDDENISTKDRGEERTPWGDAYRREHRENPDETQRWLILGDIYVKSYRN